MTMYLLNSAVLTAFGRYNYTELTLESAKAILSSRPFESAIGHQPTAALLLQLLGRSILCQRTNISMQPHDEAVVFRIAIRLPDYSELSAEQLATLPVEFGLLVRES